MTDPIRPISTRRPDIALTLLTDGSESFPCGKLVISRSLGMVEVEVEGGGKRLIIHDKKNVPVKLSNTWSLFLFHVRGRSFLCPGDTLIVMTSAQEMKICSARTE